MTLAYDEFGIPEVSPGLLQQSKISASTNVASFSNPFGFTGYQTDDISGMYYAQARYYAPTMGRFMAEDPIKDRTNWYGYCDANPLAFVDPSGLAAVVSQQLNNNVQCMIAGNKFLGLGLAGADPIPWDAVKPLAYMLPALLTSVTATKVTSAAAKATWWIPGAGKVAIAAAAVVLGVLIYQTASAMPDVRTTHAWMMAQLAKGLSHQSGSHTVYVIQDKNTGLVHYVGRTSDWTRRNRYHQLRTGARFPTTTFEMNVVRTGMTKSDASALEQSLIAANVILALANKVNAISERNLRNFTAEFNRLTNLMSPTPSTP